MFQQDSPLSGVRIIDFSHVYQGPVATQILADFGADVIKIERPGMGDWSRKWGPYVNGVSLPFANLNRNKRSITPNLKCMEGQEVIRRLIASADVLVHNFRSGVMEKLGIGYDQLRIEFPNLIYAHSSGWGDKGQNVDRNRPGHDVMARAEGGWFDFNEGQLPSYSGISIDYPAGLILTQGILLALSARQKNGCGQYISTDLLSVAFHAHSWEAANTLNQTQIDDHRGIGATEATINHSFATKDGYIEISPVFSTNALRDISLAMGLGDLSQDPRFLTHHDQRQNKDTLNEILSSSFKVKTTNEWIMELEPKGILCAQIKSLSETIQDPQIIENGMIIDIAHPISGQLKLQGTPLRLQDTPAKQKNPSPTLGQHNQELLIELGYSEQETNQMLESGVFD